MHAVIFEVWPAGGRREDYLAVAARLREELEKQPGFISVERFESLSEPGKLLSLSFWESEEAVANWRCNPDHRRAQLHPPMSATAATVELRTAARGRPRRSSMRLTLGRSAARPGA